MIPLVAPTITRRDRDYIAGAVHNGLLDNERALRRFEEAFAERVGAAGAVAVCSGTAALTLALQQTPGGIEGRPILLPSYACSATLNAVYADDVDANVHLCDSTFDVPSAQMRQDADRVGIFVTVHAFGRATLTDANADVEDWTLSLGYDAPLAAPIGVCSTNASKMISTGRGGVVFSNDPALLAEIRSCAYYDRTANGTLGAYSLGMSALQAGLGLSQLDQLDTFIARRREIAAAYTAVFARHGIECPDPDCGSVFFRYLIAVTRDPAEVLLQLAQAGIEAGRGVYPPLHQQLGRPGQYFPGVTAAVNRLVSVPCHPSLTDQQVRYIADTVAMVCAP